jgi:hypothetical protein
MCWEAVEADAMAAAAGLRALSEAADLQRDSSWEMVDHPIELQRGQPINTGQPHSAKDQARAAARQLQEAAAANIDESGLVAAAATSLAAAGVHEHASDDDVAHVTDAVRRRWGRYGKFGDENGSTAAVGVVREGREPLRLRSIAAAAAAAAAPLL